MPIQNKEVFSEEELRSYLRKIKDQRQNYIRKYYLSSDDLWVLMTPAMHNAMLKLPERTSTGPDRITRSQVLGMHVVHDDMKDVYVVPKKRPPGLGQE